MNKVFAGLFVAFSPRWRPLGLTSPAHAYPDTPPTSKVSPPQVEQHHSGQPGRRGRDQERRAAQHRWPQRAAARRRCRAGGRRWRSRRRRPSPSDQLTSRDADDSETETARAPCDVVATSASFASAQCCSCCWSSWCSPTRPSARCWRCARPKNEVPPSGGEVRRNDVAAREADPAQHRVASETARRHSDNLLWDAARPGPVARRRPRGRPGDGARPQRGVLAGLRARGDAAGADRAARTLRDPDGRVDLAGRRRRSRTLCVDCPPRSRGAGRRRRRARPRPPARPAAAT